LLPSEEAVLRSVVLRSVYLAQLYPLEAAIPGAGGNLDTDQAAVWTHNRDEVRDRAALFDLWRGGDQWSAGAPPMAGSVTETGLTK
jgi:hypothetical protein